MWISLRKPTMPATCSSVHNRLPSRYSGKRRGQFVSVIGQREQAANRPGNSSNDTPILVPWLMMDGHALNGSPSCMASAQRLMTLPAAANTNNEIQITAAVRRGRRVSRESIESIAQV